MTRIEISNMIHRNNDRKFIIVGPRYLTDSLQGKACSIWLKHLNWDFNFSEEDEDERLEAEKILGKLPVDLVYKNDYRDNNLRLIMNLNVSFLTQDEQGSIMTQTILKGLTATRQVLIELLKNVQLHCEFSNLISSVYLNDIFSCGMVAESEQYSELVSGAPYPVGFSFRKLQSALDEDEDLMLFHLQKIVDNILSSNDSQCFLGVLPSGGVAITKSLGNKDTFLTLAIDRLITNCTDDSAVGEIVKFLDDVVLQYLLNHLDLPAVAINLGRVPAKYANRTKLLLHELILNSSIVNYLVGFMIDSGDQYIPTGGTCGAVDDENEDGEAEDGNDLFTAVLSDQLKLSKKSFLSSVKTSYWKSGLSKLRFTGSRVRHSSYSSKAPADTAQFEYLISADEIIKEINELLNTRKAATS